jgi:hypothetical protein
MGTRSRIGIRNADGTITSVYCHCDGYLSHNGRLLLDHWSDEKKLRKLMKMGDMSVLGEEIGVKHDFNNSDVRGNGCTFYKRDRADPTAGKAITTDADEFIGLMEEYTYLFEPESKMWTVAYYKTGEIFIPLRREMVIEKKGAGND